MTPHTIQQIQIQLGARGPLHTNGLAYVGASKLFYVHPKENTDNECRSGFQSHFDEETGTLKYEVGLHFCVNGKRGQGWHMVVAYEPDDTYTVWLMRAYPSNKRMETGKMGEVIEHRRDVYCDELRHVVESMYDEAIKTRNQGFIPC